MLSWPRFIDIVTIVWFVIFLLTFIDFEENTNVLLANLMLILLFIFILDLLYLYRKSENYRVFFKSHWFDILMTIPFLRVLRMFRVLRILKLTKGLKLIKTAEKTSKAAKKSRRLLKKK